VLRRVLADCHLGSERILQLAAFYGLLTAPQLPAHARADALPAEPLETWRKEIRALRHATGGTAPRHAG
jgi:hypothetical protein